jgi:hypothetical protein
MSVIHRRSIALFALLAAVAVVGACSGGPGATSATGSGTGGAAQTDDPLGGPTAGATDLSAVDFKDIVLKGKGKKVAKFTIPEDAIAIAVIAHKGKSNFIVHSIDSSGATLDSLVNEIGNYTGTVLFDTDVGEHSVAFGIDADGSWTITIKPVSRAPAWNASTPLKSRGDAVYRVSPPSSGLVTVDLGFKGDGNFIVHSYSDGGSEGLANEIDNFSGQVLLPHGTFLLEIVANGGTWSMTPG